MRRLGRGVVAFEQNCTEVKSVKGNLTNNPYLMKYVVCTPFVLPTGPLHVGDIFS